MPNSLKTLLHKSVLKGAVIGLIALLFGPFRSLGQTKSSLFLAGDEYYESKKYLPAKLHYLKCRTEISSEDSLWAQLYYKLGVCEAMLKSNQAALPYYRNALKANQKASKWYVRTLNKIGIYYHDMPLLDSAEYYFKIAADYSVRFNYSASMANLRQIYIGKGDFVQAAHYALLTLHIDEANRDTAHIAASYTNLGEVYVEMKNYDLALKYFRQSIQIQMPRRAFDDLSRNHEAISNIYSELNDFKKARQHAFQALTYAQKSGDKRDIAYSLMQVGGLLTQQGRFSRANQYLNQSEVYFRSLNRPQDLAEFLPFYGKQLIIQKQHDKALARLVEAIPLLIHSKNNESLYQCYDDLSKIHELKKNFKKAHEYYKSARKIEMGRKDIETAKSLQNIMIQYETEKKEKKIDEQQIKLLKKERETTQVVVGALSLLLLLIALFTLYRWQHNRRVGKMKVEFARATRQMESFNYSVSHELNFPITQMRSLLCSLQSKVSHAPEIVQIEQWLISMDRLIQSMLLLSQVEHETLCYSTTQTQQMVQDIIDEMKLCPKVIIKFEKLPTVQADVFLLRQVFVNLIQNAVKFSSSRPIPVIKITAEQVQKKYIFRVIDNGVGFEETKSNTLFRLFGRLHSNKEFLGFGVGLSIVKTIIEKHGGRIWAESTVGQGAVFGFELPQ